MKSAYINRIATAVPEHDVHRAFINYATALAPEGTPRNLFKRMARMSGIEHRYGSIEPTTELEGHWEDAIEFYVEGAFPATDRRMRQFETEAPKLAHKALDGLKLSAEERAAITHVLVTTCTGQYAPGLDFEVVNHLGLKPTVERAVIGFMGCYAAINALRLARQIVRSEENARVLVLCLEMCTLHFQESHELEQLLSFLVFADGAAAALVTGDAAGFEMESFQTVVLPGSEQLITWRVGNQGFDIELSGQVPGEIGKNLKEAGLEVTRGTIPAEIPLWAVHAGGKSILDQVEKAMELPAAAMAPSRSVLARFGNMSSATVMFVLSDLLAAAKPGERGCAMAFGPGLSAETMLFRSIGL